MSRSLDLSKRFVVRPGSGRRSAAPAARPTIVCNLPYYYRPARAFIALALEVEFDLPIEFNFDPCTVPATFKIVPENETVAKIVDDRFLAVVRWGWSNYLRS